ncbi:hypothetical protein E3W66_02830 [Gammaproteobacteria bacterium LSUCC0057]|uniref:GNAT family N-acetyltransferase n=1 Tax=Gammaproteobacteria bacterium LSUCC0057 TaxID=2559237 RepID=A0A4Y8UKA7_9GAMM|nr:hypothetical protein E3W66_02830 [Gammaproteobacteria bacterium LSUCC0057]
MPTEVEIVWRHQNESMDQELLQYWQYNAIAVDPAHRDKRLRQLAAVARDSQGSLVGVATMSIVKLPEFNNFFFHYRTSTALAARSGNSQTDYRQRVDTYLYDKVFAYFNQRYDPAAANQPIGLYITVSTPRRLKVMSAAQEPYSGLLFVGYNRRGEQLHVKYFDGARIDRVS